MIEIILIFALATFINISGVKAATNLHDTAPTKRTIVTVEDVNDEEPESLLEALQKMK
ncbi:MAG: hypothetical protein KUG73_01525 [Pseudomonadales bacterium]|nr:hypothetical protein [Pseudomonadales bacterium]